MNHMEGGYQAFSGKTTCHPDFPLAQCYALKTKCCESTLINCTPTLIRNIFKVRFHDGGKNKPRGEK